MRKRFYSLKKIKVRQSWNKYNLYQLSRLPMPYHKSMNYFQQKWASKSLTRAYHGEQVRERQWERMFDRRLRAVVPMSPEYLARSDGSKEAAGRGSGVERQPDAKRIKATMPTPYMNMTYAPLERRLDVAIHRALFASSTRQARQFCVHGAVRVNGQKMIYPGYLLNPGDMFQVEPERVMYATGAPKVTEVEESEPEDATSESKEESLMEAASEDEPSGDAVTEIAAASVPRTGSEVEHKEPDNENVPEAPSEQTDKQKRMEAELDSMSNQETLKTLLGQAKTILSSSKDVLPAKRKQELRAFQQEVRRVLSRSSRQTIMTDSLEAQFLEMKNQLQLKERRAETERGRPSKARNKSETSSSEGANASTTADLTDNAIDETLDSLSLSAMEMSRLRRALEELRENPIDATKPYATPWRPRDYMSAFAFVPRFLEVHPTICAAVYLRHPVARPGLAEVPTPFNSRHLGLAFNWYLRRR